MSTGQPLRQSTILNALEKMPSTAQSSKKRYITLINGAYTTLEKLDLHAIDENKTISSEVVRAMKARIIELEDQLDSQPPPAKRARKTAPTEEDASSPAGPSTSAPTAASTKAEEKKKKQQFKKIYDRMKKECNLDTCKFQGSTKTIKIDDVLEVAEFESMFSGKGTQIQPTPNNKPKSTVTIISFNKPQVAALFGDELKALKGKVWSRGGGPSFAKSLKLGTCDVEIQSLEVNYSKNGMKCSMKFDVHQVGGDDLEYESYGMGRRHMIWF
ncbi:hypothetical protein HWV62_43989 [Athelia sp. TMB]|nr:hypothetical protein HWV62_43989 [Athelia sp. TMB]